MLLGSGLPPLYDRRLIDDFFAENPTTPGSDKVDTAEADEVIDAIAKTVAELTSQQDGVIRQQVIEQLMSQIMHYDGEFRRVEATSAVGSSASTDGGSDRMEYGTILTRPPCWTRGVATKKIAEHRRAAPSRPSRRLSRYSLAVYGLVRRGSLSSAIGASSVIDIAFSSWLRAGVGSAALPSPVSLWPSSRIVGGRRQSLDQWQLTELMEGWG